MFTSKLPFIFVFNICIVSYQCAMQPEWNRCGTPYLNCHVADKYCFYIYDALKFYGVKDAHAIPVMPIDSETVLGQYVPTEDTIFVNEKADEHELEINLIHTCAHEAGHTKFNRERKEVQEKLFLQDENKRDPLVWFNFLPSLGVCASYFFLSDRIAQVESTAALLGIGIVPLIMPFIMHRLTTTKSESIASKRHAKIAALMKSKDFEALHRLNERQADKRAAQYLAHIGRAQEYLDFKKPRLNVSYYDLETGKTALLGDITDNVHATLRKKCQWTEKALHKKKSKPE